MKLPTVTTECYFVNQKLNELQETIDFYNEGNTSDALDLVSTGRGKDLMDEIRIIINDMMSEEERLLAERIQHPLAPDFQCRYRAYQWSSRMLHR